MSDHRREIERLLRENEELRRENEAERREKEAERREKEAERREKEAERRKNQKTTLEEYLYNNHFHLYKKLALADKFKSSTGFTKVEGKYYPKWLRPWTSSMNAQRQGHFEAIRRVCGERRLFHQESTTRDLGSTIHRKRAGNENAVDHFEKLAVEDPVWEILCPAWDDEELRKEYRCMGLRFSNNIRDFTQPSDNVLDAGEGLSEEWPERRRRTGPNKRAASEQRVKPPPTKPDGAGVRTRLGGDESLAFVYDYKAVHKVALEHLKPAVVKETLFMEVMERINSNKSLSDAKLRVQDRAEELVAMMLTQVFDYMVRYGVAYGYIAAGESLLLLHIDRANLQTLYCHPCMPNEDVGESSDGHLADDKVSYTAAAQLASFCLLSLRSEALKGAPLDAAFRKAEAELKKWREPYDDMARLVGVEDTNSSSASSSQATEVSEFMSSAAPASREVSLRSRTSCRSTAVLRRGEADEEDDGPDGDTCQSWARTDVSKRKEGPSSGSSEGGEEEEDDEMSESAPVKQYCTQACLLGLKRGLDLDSECPNVLSHRSAEGGTRHPIDAHDFARLVGERLRKNPYRDCEALDGWRKMGATGVLFKLELAPYGYTFVGKGATESNPLEHETKIYTQLDRIQGQVVPVYLGLVQLDQGHILPGGARVFHMMLMSWCGETTANTAVANAGSGATDLEAEVRRSSQAVCAEGVNHGDESETNRLWNNERRCVMLIDFDRATLRPNPEHNQLAKVSGRKRKRRGGELQGYNRNRDVRQYYPQSV
ncbi:metalloprotease [Fusarium coicis]|nr:metalloprotease [Fusarium coicis]